MNAPAWNLRDRQRRERLARAAELPGVRGRHVATDAAVALLEAVLYPYVVAFQTVRPPPAARGKQALLGGSARNCPRRYLIRNTTPLSLNSPCSAQAWSSCW